MMFPQLPRRGKHICVTAKARRSPPARIAGYVRKKDRELRACAIFAGMSVRALLVAGIGLLVTGLLFVLAIDAEPSTASPKSALVQGYLSSASALIGAGLIVVAALLSALRKKTPAEPPSIDHYS